MHLRFYKLTRTFRQVYYPPISNRSWFEFEFKTLLLLQIGFRFFCCKKPFQKPFTNPLIGTDPKSTNLLKKSELEKIFQWLWGGTNVLLYKGTLSRRLEKGVSFFTERWSLQFWLSYDIGVWYTCSPKLHQLCFPSSLDYSSTLLFI